MNREFNVIVEKDEDGIYIGSVPELPGCHTQASTLDELQERIKEAIELYLEANEKELSDPIKFIGIQRVEVTIEKA